ncbi:MAG: tetratricopeptide repeat protein [Candidatus Aminicenantia bacterium]
MKRAIFFTVLFIIPVLLFSGVQGGIKGKILDKSTKAPIEGVKVTITSMEYSIVRFTLKTKSDGSFIQTGLHPGYYQIKFEKEGYIPGIAEIKVSIAEISAFTGELESTKSYIESKASPGDKAFRKGNEEFQKGNFEDAEKSYKEALSLEPQEPIYLYNLAITLIREGKDDEALTYLQKMLEIQLNSYSANKAVAEIYSRKGNYEEAGKFYRKAVELSPNDPDAFYNLGACLKNTSNYKDAMDAFEKAVELKPDFADAYYELSTMYINQNLTEKAISALEKFISLAKEDHPNLPIAKQMLQFLKK